MIAVMAVLRLAPTLKCASMFVYIEGMSSMHFFLTFAFLVVSSSLMTLVTIVLPLF